MFQIWSYGIKRFKYVFDIWWDEVIAPCFSIFPKKLQSRIKLGNANFSKVVDRVVTLVLLVTHF